ncbi:MULTISPECIES: hypothetical protein [unclassified Sphingomonas]|uniref:hypothetical protein n=1 Tax=unclassified Sphingomonas TaxID=196159 RepID=UPI0006F69305|nr:MULTISPECIES: hypothetical protein [unclassified Sphingomonas]KQM61663.1 hypothetical protein ASE65_05415 [Sphingomonas sp. Leaf16]KQN12936.1 hypothetical protein ASE81_06430 [Sphingomonas sp. Leaf29]KQN19823.1 hypothetical protein ASE83_06355 [Sphingomonas sp. Leaf32]
MMRTLRWIATGIMAAGAAWIAVDMLQEAYGARPPYHGQVANMDKWTSPWPTLIAIEWLALLVALTLLRGRTDKRR